MKFEKPMTIVAFWSYKGGTGRSLAAVNVAYALSRAGEDVAILDADIDSPGMVYKLWEPVRSLSDADKARLDKGGLVDVLEDRFLSGESGQLHHRICDYSVQVSFPQQAGEPKPGTIHFIPAGNLTEDYWQKVEALRRASVFSYSLPSNIIESTKTFAGKLPKDAGDAYTHLLKELEASCAAEMLADGTRPWKEVSQHLEDFGREKMLERDAAELHGILERLTQTMTDSQDKRRIYSAILDEIKGDLEPSPRYLLVDTRSGITEVQGIVLRLWADKVIPFFVHNVEGVASFKSLLPEVQKLESPRGRAPQVIPVLSRFSPALYRQFGFDLTRLLEQYGVLKGQLQLVHEDRYLELRDDVALAVVAGPELRPADSRSVYRQVSMDYVDLAASVMTTADPRTSPESWAREKAWNKERLCRWLHIGEVGLQDELVFASYRDFGEIVNVVDHARNVSFKVETLNALLRDLREGIVVEFKTEDPDSVRSKFAIALREAGAKSGGAFGESLRRVWQRGAVTKRKAPKAIQDWCEFDSAVGWGVFGADVPPDSEDIPKMFHICVRNPFLDWEESSSTADLTPFLTGYIQGVLTEILERPLKVDRDPTSEYRQIRFKVTL